MNDKWNVMLSTKLKSFQELGWKEISVSKIDCKLRIGVNYHWIILITRLNVTFIFSYSIVK